MNKGVANAVGLALTGLLSITAAAQNASAKAALSPSQAVLTLWNDVGRTVLAMAEDSPDDKYEFKPAPAQRSFADQLLHVAGSNDFFTQVAKGQKPLDDESGGHYPTKAAV